MLCSVSCLFPSCLSHAAADRRNSKMYDEFCTPRVLVMEWIDGACRMTDRKRLEDEMGLSVKKVSQSVCEAFASQIFQHGFVQADGHPS